MGRMIGADIGDLERGAAGLESVGCQIGGLRRPLRSQLYSSNWYGGAADRFRNDWDRVHGPALSDAEAFLREAGRTLRAEANQQRTASGIRTVPFAGPGGRGGFDRNIALVSSLVDLLDLSSEAITRMSELNKLAGLGKTGGALTSIAKVGGKFLGGISLGLAGYDLVFDDNGYGGHFHNVERTADGLAGLGSTLTVLSPLAFFVGGPLAVAGVATAGLALEGASIVVDITMEYWNGRGRQDWKATKDAVGSAYTNVTKTVSSAAAKVDQTWDTAYEAVGTGVGAVGEAAADTWDAVKSGGSGVISLAKGWL